MKMEETLKSGVEQMKVIFDLCDQDNDGLIYAKDFRKIGQEHFEKPDKVDALLQVMDPLNTGKISFIMFCRGIETFLLESQYSAESSITSLTSEMNGSSSEVKDCEDDFYGDYVYPVSQHNGASLSNGYMTPNSTEGAGVATVELIVDQCEESDLYSPNPRHHSTPTSNTVSAASSAAASRQSPTLLASHLLWRHQLTLPEGSSQGSTPAEGEEVVCKLNDQLQDLSCRLEELEEDQKDSKGYRVRLRKENAELRARLEECEDMLRVSEQANEKTLAESQERLRISVIKVRREGEVQVLDLRAQLQQATDRITKMENAEITLKAQLFLTEEEKLIMEKEAVELEERRNSVQDTLHKTRELLRLERDKWRLERGTLSQAIQERDLHMQQLRQDCEDMQTEQKKNFITISDTEREINRLKKKLEQSEHRNDELQSRFLQEGKKLLAASSSAPSLAMEIDRVSKDELVQRLDNSDEINLRLRTYIDGLLTSIIEKHPEMLEKM